MITLHFDPLDIELGDLDVFETLAGADFEEVFSKKKKGTAELKALYYLIKRQNDPEFTVEQLAKVKLRDVVDVAEAIEEATANPTEGGAAS